MEEFDNIDRDRYYGLRKGDIVIPHLLNGEPHGGDWEVVEYTGDNNRVEIKSSEGKITDWVAEWCEIKTKVEDR